MSSAPVRSPSASVRPASRPADDAPASRLRLRSGAGRRAGALGLLAAVAALHAVVLREARAIDVPVPAARPAPAGSGERSQRALRVRTLAVAPAPAMAPTDASHAAAAHSPTLHEVASRAPQAAEPDAVALAVPGRGVPPAGAPPGAAVAPPPDAPAAEPAAPGLRAAPPAPRPRRAPPQEGGMAGTIAAREATAAARAPVAPTGMAVSPGPATTADASAAPMPGDDATAPAAPVPTAVVRLSGARTDLAAHGADAPIAPRGAQAGDADGAAPPPDIVLAAVFAAPAAGSGARDGGPPSAAEVPLYRTRLPPPVLLAYDLKRGPLTGTGELEWKPEGERYTARLEGKVLGVRAMVWESRGVIDAHGIAPVRYTDSRRSRSAQAANFRRTPDGGGRITYSGPSDEVPLPRGAQDRLSWMVQLAAIGAADPSRVGPGGRVSMFVTGARADADVWTFSHVATEPLVLGDRKVETLHLVREPRGEHDTRAEIWLDPSRHHLPVRARLSNGKGRDAGDALELTLRP